MAYQMLIMRPCSYVISVNRAPLRDLGNFYMGFASRFREGLPLENTHTGIYPLPLERAIDINTMEDWELAEAMYEKLHLRKVSA
jgi:CMP-N-acetylneuraminic acid synthetase